MSSHPFAIAMLAAVSLLSSPATALGPTILILAAITGWKVIDVVSDFLRKTAWRREAVDPGAGRRRGAARGNVRIRAFVVLCGIAALVTLDSCAAAHATSALDHQSTRASKLPPVSDEGKLPVLPVRAKRGGRDTNEPWRLTVIGSGEVGEVTVSIKRSVPDSDIPDDRP